MRRRGEDRKVGEGKRRGREGDSMETGEGDAMEERKRRDGVWEMRWRRGREMQWRRGKERQ